MVHLAARLRRPADAAGRLLVLLVALAGLFAMHGLADHGAAHHGAATGTAISTPHHSAAGTHGAPGAGAHGSTTTAEESLDVPAPPDGDALTAVGTCLAVLVTVAGLLLVVHPRRRAEALTRRLPVGAFRTALARARDPVGPDLHRLSIQRC
jgi:hypothetical protein